MLATILLLAQLVLPGPPSGPIQPQGMICLGECAGPVVWGPAERGRLVVACDMTSDTCSDGRKIATVRASPVPCETSPGVWEMVPEDTGCYSVRGLESWAATTTYLSYGAELDRSPWSSLRSGTIQTIADGYRITSAAGQTQVSGRIQVLGSQPDDGTVALSCIVRTDVPIDRLTLEAGTGVLRHISPMDTGGRWETVFVSGTVTAGSPRWVGIGPRNNDLSPASVDVRACWYTHTDTAGRACWGGEAPVTCDGDRHTVSTEGWPTESGEISLVYTPQGVGIGTWMYLAATTAIGEARPSGFYLYRISASGALVFGLRRGDTISAQATQGLEWENGRSYHVRVRWSPERAEIWRDGVLLRSWVPTVVPDSQPGTAVIGTHLSGTNPAQGSIRALTVRSYKEVSP